MRYLIFIFIVLASCGSPKEESQSEKLQTLQQQIIVLKSKLAEDPPRRVYNLDDKAYYDKERNVIVYSDDEIELDMEIDL